MTKNRSLLIIFLIIFVNLLGFGIIIPLLPFYADGLGATPFQIGLLFASYSIGQIVASPILGNLSDQHGRRPILLLSLLGTVASFALLALANSLWLLFVARIVDGLSGGNISTARAYISDVTVETDRARAYGLIGAAFGLGFIFGPALGGLLSNLSYTAPAWGAAAFALVAFGLTWIWLPESHRRIRAGRAASWRALPTLLTRPVLGQLLTLDFLYWASFAVYQTTFALFGKIRFDFNIAQTGYLLTLVGMIGVVVQLRLVGPLVQRYGEKRVLATGLVLAAIGLGSAAVVHTVPVFIVTLIPAAVGAALSSPTLTALLSQTTLPSEQGRVQGVSGALESLGRAVGPLWGNGVLQAFGEGTAYASAAAMLLLIGLATAWVPLKAAPQPGADGQPPSLALKPDPDAPLQPGTD